MTAPWWQQTFWAADTETTGISVEDDRVVTASLICTAKDTADQHWLIDPLIDIPAGATAIHGISTEKARAEGLDAAFAINEITEKLAQILSAGIPVVLANSPYDLTLLDRECRRHQIATLTDRLGHEPRPIIDVQVIDKAVDRYRRGSRRLDALAAHYGCQLDQAHTSADDALAAARIAWRLAQQHPAIGDADLTELHEQQKAWRVEQQESLREYFEKKGTPAADIHTEWPLKAVAA